MRYLMMICVVILFGCATLKNISAKMTTPKNEVKPGPTASGGPAPNAIGGGGVTPKAIKKSGPDVLGIRLGMTIEEAEAIVKKHFTDVSDSGARVRPNARPDVNRRLNGRIKQTDSAGWSEDIIAVMAIASGDRYVVTEVKREKRGMMNRDMGADLRAKYGDHLRGKFGPHGGEGVWSWTSSGKPTATPQMCNNIQLDTACGDVDIFIKVRIGGGGHQGFVTELSSRSAYKFAETARANYRQQQQRQYEQQRKEQAKQHPTSL